MSYTLSSTVLALIGVGLTFSGIILIFVVPRQLVRGDVAILMTLSPFRTLSLILEERNYRGRAIYMPPRSVSELALPRMFIPKDNINSIPNLINRDDNSRIAHDPEGILLNPVGVDLAKVFESLLGNRLSDITLEHSRERLPDILTNKLQLFSSVAIVINGNQINVRMSGQTSYTICDSVRNLSDVHQIVGCPFCSAIGVILSDISGRPCILENSALEDGITINNDYKLINE